MARGWAGKGKQKEEKRFTSQTNYNLVSSLAWKIEAANFGFTFGSFIYLFSTIKISLHELKRPHLPKRGDNPSLEN